MAYSYALYTGNGSTTQFAVPFNYARREHVFVTVDGFSTAFTWVNSGLVQTTAAPASGTAVRVYRSTPLDEPLVDFTDGATLVAADLDANSRQSVYTQQELSDNLTENFINIVRDGDKGDIVTSLNGTAWTIDSGAVTSAKIANGTIVNEDISTSAAIAASKLAFSPAGNIAATTVQNAIQELDQEKISFENLTGARNRIINGDMRIDQRNAGTSVTPTVDRQYTLDRWSVFLSAASKFSVQQTSTSGLPTFAKSLTVTSLAATTITTTSYYGISQVIEGHNVADLSWGTSGAKPLTLSFWVRSSLTGAFGGSVFSGDAGRFYPFNYGISAANTWEYKTIYIAGPTSGTWPTDSSAGLCLAFGLGVGTTFSGPLASWATSPYLSATGSVSLVGTSGATLSITGVQLESGSLATPFERRFYGTELLLCQRYFETSYNAGTAVGATSALAGCIVNTARTSGDFYDLGSMRWLVKKRAGTTGGLLLNLYHPLTGASGFYGFNTPSSTYTWDYEYLGDSGVGRLYCNSSNLTVNDPYAYHYSVSAEI